MLRKPPAAEGNAGIFVCACVRAAHVQHASTCLCCFRLKNEKDLLVRLSSSRLHSAPPPACRLA